MLLSRRREMQRDVYKRQLMDGLDEDAVDRGAEQNQDSVEAGMMETDSYDREQLVNDGVVMDGVIYNPDVEANAEIYRTFNFLESGNGLYISSLNSGLLYYNGETKEDVYKRQPVTGPCL